MRALHAVVLFAGLLVCGALGEPYIAGEVAFSAIERQEFNAFGVVHDREAPSDAPLIVRVNVVGDAADADLGSAFDWLEEHANIVALRDSGGAPLYLTAGDLAATSGRGTLGATVPVGMAVEVRDPRIAPCIIAHEMLHFVGLKHVEDKSNIMYPHCSKDFLDHALLTQRQYDQLSTLDTIRATTTSGVVVWASRD